MHMPDTPHTLYRRLLAFFGPQGWWPTTPKGGRAPAYRPLNYGRRTARERFEICVGAILTQNTAWKNVEKAIAQLNEARALDLHTICRMPRARLAGLIRSSGYYNQKAVRLKHFASYVHRTRRGRISLLFAGRTADARAELLALPGIGPETADSMLLYAGGKPVFVVDAYTRRIAGRRFGTGDDYAQLQQYFEERLPRSVKVYNEFHALIVALGKDYCRTKPRCGECPVRKGCGYGSRRDGPPA